MRRSTRPRVLPERIDKQNKEIKNKFELQKKRKETLKKSEIDLIVDYIIEQINLEKTDEQIAREIDGFVVKSKIDSNKVSETEKMRLIRQAKGKLLDNKRKSINKNNDLELEIMYLIAIGKEEEIAQILSAIFEKDKINSDSISGIKQTMEELYELVCKEEFFHEDGKLYWTIVKSKLSDLLRFDDRFKILDRSRCETSIPNVGAIPNGIEIVYMYIKMRHDRDKKEEKTKQKRFRERNKAPRSRWS